MEQFTYSTFGDLSDEVATIVRSVATKDYSDPLNVIDGAIDWSTWYSEDGEPLDGSASEAFPDGRPSLLYSQWTGGDKKNYLDVFVAGAATRAHDLPFRFSATSPTAAVLVRQVPRPGGGHQIQTDIAIVFQNIDGTSPIVKRYRQNIQ